ncbi:methyltransferase [Alteromonas sp. CYL-A6]|uniref:methyltransferase n=1 Tax=Alteromonas nitratireducens TaxID=3390813 RepID=UPI0034B31D94
MLSPQSQLLERNLTLFEQGEWVIINPTDAYFTDSIKHIPLRVIHQYFDIFSESIRVLPVYTVDSRDVVSGGLLCRQKVGDHLHDFTPFTTEQGIATDVLIYLPKSKAHFSMLLRQAAGLLKAGGRIHVVGENKGGIKSAAKLMQQYGATMKVDSARHCSLITTDVAVQHGPFEPDVWLETITYQCNGRQWDVVSMPGVFSHGELDNGTHLLLEKCSQTLRGDILDFACGAGVVGSFLKTSYPHLTLHYLDVSALALYCCAQTLQENQQTGQLIAANGLHGVSLSVNHIITNPPFHTGVKTDYSITKRFIEDASRILKSGGTLQMVANRFLPYPGLLSEHFAQVHTVAQTTQFSVYQATRA